MVKRFIEQPTSFATWQGLVDEAAQRAGYHCDENVENYLILTLSHFTTDNHLSSVVIALDFLLALDSIGRLGGRQMRTVGDECLLLAGLFPERANRKHVPLEYFIGMGRAAYQVLTRPNFKLLYDTELFTTLSHDFPDLIAVLQTMRKIK